jgi:hypothetical protein
LQQSALTPKNASFLCHAHKSIWRSSVSLSIANPLCIKPAQKCLVVSVANEVLAINAFFNSQRWTIRTRMQKAKNPFFKAGWKRAFDENEQKFKTELEAARAKMRKNAPISEPIMKSKVLTLQV